MEFTPSLYQENIFKEIKTGSGDILIKAVAGSGKTTTIVESLKYISSTKTTGFFAFNNHIVEELRNRCPSYVDVTTLHSYGWRHMLSYYDGAKLNPNKIYHYCEKLLSRKVEFNQRAWYFIMISKLVDLLRLNVLTRKNELIDISLKHNLDLTEKMIDDAMSVFLIACEDKKQFDFVDMIYVPAILDDIKLKLYDILFVDEAQDLSVVQIMLIDKIIKKKGRLISVGDPKQAIYGFAGSDAESFKKLENRPNTISLPLSVCYRCSKSIVMKAKEIVDYIEPFDKSPIGTVKEEGTINDARKGDWVLCRNVKPLVMLYVDTISRGKKAHIKGEDIGKTLINLIKQTKERSMRLVILKLIGKLKSLKKELKSKKVIDVDKHPKVGFLSEMISVIIFLSNKYKTVDNIENVIVKMFKDNGEGILLSTIHKSKGLENDRVFIICPELIPSKYAVKDWQLEQEENLKYVAYTRAKKELIIVRDFKDSITDYSVHFKKAKSQLTELLTEN